jgi:hypothetical protein
MEGMENDLLNVTWQVELMEVSTGSEIELLELSSPVKSAVVLAILAVMLIGVGEDVDRKFIHFMV